MSRRWLTGILSILIGANIAIGFVGYQFMEREGKHVARRLAEATARNIADRSDIYAAYAPNGEGARVIQTARDRFDIPMQILPPSDLPPAQPKLFWTLLDRELSEEISRNVRRPFWIDTIGQLDLVDVRVRHDDATLRFIAPRTRIFRAGQRTFVSWTVVSSALFLIAALLLIRRPI